MSLIRSFFALWLCVGSGFAFSQTPFKFQQGRGPFPVGLSIVYQYDRTRPDFTPDKKLSPSLPDKSGRPLQTLIWFPSESTTEKPMTVGDYAHIADAETLSHPCRWMRWREAGANKTGFILLPTLSPVPQIRVADSTTK
jgi:hypothetical protein